jgi:hypothetical protein
VTASALRETVAETLVRGCAETVFAAVSASVERLWPGRVTTVVHEPPTMLVVAICSDDGSDVDGWLTWDVSPSICGWVRLRARFEEAEPGPVPAPELDALLVAVLAACESSYSDVDG